MIAVSSVMLYSQGDVVLPLPSIEVLAEVAGSQARTSIVVHVLESFVVTWMKLIKVCTVCLDHVIKIMWLLFC